MIRESLVEQRRRKNREKAMRWLNENRAEVNKRRRERANAKRRADGIPKRIFYTPEEIREREKQRHREYRAKHKPWRRRDRSDYFRERYQRIRAEGLPEAGLGADDPSGTISY